MLLRALLAACCAALSSGLFFYVTSEAPRCFIEEVPAETLIVGEYKNPDFVVFGSPGFTGAGVKYEIRDPNSAVVKSAGCDGEGRFAFTSAMGGEYTVCFLSNATRWGDGRRFRVDLKLEIGDVGIDYNEVAKKEHLTELEVEIRRLNDKVKGIIKVQAYQREREIAFRNTSESTNSRVQYWSLFQTCVMISSGVWQIMHLKTFFKSKKIV